MPSTSKSASAKRRPRAKPVSTIEDNFRIRLPIARSDRSMSQAQLAQRLTELGYPMHETTVARIESGARKVTLNDAVVIAAALGCQLTHLIVPPDDAAEVRLSPKVKASATRVRQWLRGMTPLYLDDARFYFTGKLVPDSEMTEFFARRPAWAAYGPTWPDAEEGGQDAG